MFVGPKHHPITVNEDLFHRYVPDFADEFRQRDHYGEVKSISLPNTDPKDVEALIMWMEGKKGMFTDQHVYEGLGYNVHDLACFKLFKLAAEMNIGELMEETLGLIEACLAGGKWPVTVEAVIAAYRSDIPYMEALKARLICGAVEEHYTGGRVGGGSLWKNAVRVDAAFDTEVAVGIGYHLTRSVDDCKLEKCYMHKPQKSVNEWV